MRRVNLPLLAAGAFAWIWVIARANLQSVTLDEADSYLGYVATDWPSHFYPSSGNHVLNSILARILIGLFGLWHVTLRGPSILGALIYIAAMYGFCNLLSETKPFQLLLFICLVYNPFILDYLVAARGYSLALGFLSAALFLLTRQLIKPDAATLYRDMVIASICAGLSFTANFSFAFVDAVVLGVFAIWEVRKMERTRDRASWAAACVLPALLVAFLVCGSTVMGWSLNQPYFGSHSLAESLAGIIDSSFYELNDYIAHPLLKLILARIQPALPLLFVGILLAQLAFMAVQWRSLRDVALQRLALAEGFLISILIISVVLHWAAFHLWRILLPKERAAIYFVTLSVLATGLGTAICSRLRFGYVPQVFSLALLSIGALYFIACLRLDYFKEWKFGADVRAAYPVVEKISRCYGIREIPSEWMYDAGLRFYQRYYGNAVLKISFAEPYPAGKDAYVVRYDSAKDFIKQQGLRVVYHGSLSDMAVLIRDHQPAAADGACP